MKYLVETLGNYGLHDLMGGQTIKANRATVVEATPFVERMTGFRLVKLEVLADDASDETLQLARDDDELELAISNLPRPTKPAPAAKPAPKKG